MFQLWILNAEQVYQKVGPIVTHANGLQWIVTLRQHFDVREFRLLPEVTPADFVVTPTTRWPGE